MTLSCCVQDPAEKGVVGYNRITQEEHHDFYKQWTGDNFPRFLVVEVQHPTPCAQPGNDLTRAPSFLAVCCCCGLVCVCAAFLS